MTAPQTYVQTPAAKAAYDARWQRIMDCVNLKQPDRMPVSMFATFWLAKYGGITNRQLMYDYEKVEEIGERAIVEFEPDAHSPWCCNARSARSLDAIGFKQLQWPGHGVSDTQPYQYLDREYMKADEYDEFLFDPTGYYLSKYLPRVAGAFEGLDELPYLPGLHYLRLLSGIIPFINPRIRESMEKVIKAAEEVKRLNDHQFEFIARMKCSVSRPPSAPRRSPPTT